LDLERNTGPRFSAYIPGMRWRSTKPLCWLLPWVTLPGPTRQDSFLARDVDGGQNQAAHEGRHGTRIEETAALCARLRRRFAR